MTIIVKKGGAMPVKEIQSKIVALLESEKYNGGILTSDYELCKLVGEKNYEKIHNALNSMKNDGQISWYRTGDGSVNNITLIK